MGLLREKYRKICQGRRGMLLCLPFLRAVNDRKMIVLLSKTQKPITAAQFA